jgi:hypothetical protein
LRPTRHPPAAPRQRERRTIDFRSITSRHHRPRKRAIRYLQDVVMRTIAPAMRGATAAANDLFRKSGSTFRIML